MTTPDVYTKEAITVLLDEDIELKNEFALLIGKITGNDMNLISSSLDELKSQICSYTSTLTAVPKPLKYLTHYYQLLKETHSNLENDDLKQNLADVISYLAIGQSSETNLDCLVYYLQGTMKNIEIWGHEYVRRLEKDISTQWWMHSDEIDENIIKLVQDIITFDCRHNAEIQACDLLMEIDALNYLQPHIFNDNYKRICRYLTVCAKYVDAEENVKINRFVCYQYLNCNDYLRCLITALQYRDDDITKAIFNDCNDKAILYQMGFICARHTYPIEQISDNLTETLTNVVNNCYLSNYFHALARELEITEPNTPEDIYKTWLEPTTHTMLFFGPKLDSARTNLASTFVNAFINSGFGTDKLMLEDKSNVWIYKNKDLGMMSATASLGLIYLWDVEGGLMPIDKFFYSENKYIQAGALLGSGILSCRVRTECDPPLGLLRDYLLNDVDEILQIGAILGIGLAYAGSNRNDILDLIFPIINYTESVKIFAMASLTCGLISLGKYDNLTPLTILTKLMEFNITDSSYIRLACLGFSLCHLQARDKIDVAIEAFSAFEEPFRAFITTTLTMCAYAGTGDVLIVQKFLHLIADDVSDVEVEESWDFSLTQAVAVIGISVVAIGEEIGTEMVHRLLGAITHYTNPTIRRAVPLALALTSISNPQLNIIESLTKYSHDPDVDVSCNAIFALGLIGAGTNNAKIALNLRQLAVYHYRNSWQLFVVRISQGLVHMGRGALGLNTMHTDGMLIDLVGLTGLIIPIFCMLEKKNFILSSCHYMFYVLALAIQPRWLLTLDEDLEIVNVAVRVGQAIDTIGKVGMPKTLAGTRTQTTPILLATFERAELETEEFDASIMLNNLNGICVLKKLEK